jgi:hypothetical protein
MRRLGGGVGGNPLDACQPMESLASAYPPPTSGLVQSAQRGAATSTWALLVTSLLEVDWPFPLRSFVVAGEIATPYS